MGKWSTEQGQDAIAQDLRDIAFVAMHGVHHKLQGWINERPRFFRVEALNQRRRTFEVSEEGGDRLAFAISWTTGFHCRLLSPDAVGEMRRSPESRKVWSSELSIWGLERLGCRPLTADCRLSTGNWQLGTD